MKIPGRSNQVTLFVDEKTESKLTTQSMEPDGPPNVLVARLYLDRLGLYGQIFRFLGILSTLYVTKAGSINDTSSQTIGLQSVEEAGC